MQVVFGFIYYFIVVMIGATVLLAAFYFRSLRQIFFNFTSKNQWLVQNIYVSYAFYVSFSIIGIIFLQSLWTYFTLDEILHKGTSKIKNFTLDNIESVKAEHRDDYLLIYREYREYYMAERNIMLTSSALFIYFVFQRLVANIKKLCDLENQIEVEPEVGSKSGGEGKVKKEKAA